MEKQAKRLLELLDESVKKSCEKKTGVIFSSGIDSAIIAQLASRHCEVVAYTIGGPNSEDLAHSRNAMKAFDFRIETVDLTEEGIEKTLPRLVGITGSTQPLQVSVGVPMYYASMKAKEEGISVMLSGQGGDELFGGYNRYLRHVEKGDYAGLEKEMTCDFDSAYEDNLNRDIACCKANDVDLRFPYLGKEFVDYTRAVPYNLKVYELAEGEKPQFTCVDDVAGRRFIRKYILRKMGEELNLPRAILDRKKKAAQYGSGSEKMIEKLAKKHGFKDKARSAGREDYVKMYLESLVE